jgi:hypothetical protein
LTKPSEKGINTCSNAKDSQPSQHHHREVIEEYGLVRRAYKNTATESGQYNNASIVTPGIFPNKLHETLKLRNAFPALYILIQKAVILNRRRIVRKFFAEQ